MRNSDWMYMSLHQRGSGADDTGQGQSQGKSGVEHGRAGNEITGRTRLAK